MIWNFFQKRKLIKQQFFLISYLKCRKILFSEQGLIWPDPEGNISHNIFSISSETILHQTIFVLGGIIEDDIGNELFGIQF